MGKRKDALMRLLFGVVLLILMYVIGFIITVFLYLWAAVDIVWQLITGREGLSPGGLATGLWDWLDQNSRYVFFGQGSWSWTP